MTKLFNNFSKLLLSGLLLLAVGCERELDELQPATFPSSADVFIDGFTGGLQYAAFGGSDVTAFDTDTEIKYSGTTSMRFAVPDFEDPAGAYAGGAFFLGSGRDLSGYNVLTFWARASQPANIDIIGLGNDLGSNDFVASVSGLAVNTNWKKYYIPIPDPSKLTQERGMLFYSEGPENNRGYTFWIDEVKFENLGTVVPVNSGVFNGEDRVETVETGALFSADGFATFSLPSGIEQRVAAAPSYFEFSSSNPSVASVDINGQVMVIDAGEAVITASLGDVRSVGSLSITSTGEPVLPQSSAPTPEVPADDVISIFSDTYTDIPVDFYNGFWEFSTTQSANVQIAADDEAIRYSQLNFVGIQFTSPTVDAAAINRIHLDIWTPDATDAPTAFKILLVDLGPDGSFGGDDDSSHEITITSPTLQTESWVSIDLPLTDFPGLTARSNLAQIVLSGDIPNVFMDNLYLYDDGNGGGGGGGDNEPMVAAPTPTRNSADVISLFSDAYDDVPVDTWRTDWSEAVFADVTVDGNATKKYSALNFVGIETVANQIDVTGMTNLHMDVWSADFTSFSVKLVDFGPDGAFDGGDDTEYQIDVPMPDQNTWIDYNFALDDFVDLTTRNNIAQVIFVGQPASANTVFVDNLYFFNDDGSGGGPTEPAVAAPMPVQDAADVISLFSDAYNDVTVDTWRTDWSSVTFEDVTVAGNATKKYSDLDFVGIETTMNTVDASAMTNFRMDVWSADYTLFAIKLVDFGADGVFDGGDDVEHQIDIEMPAQAQWVSIDIPLSDFTGLTTRSNIAQYILVGQPTGLTTVFIDNMYFYSSGGGGDPTMPSVAAPTPTLDEANVISLFSDAYTDVTVDTWRTDWSAATFEDVTVAGNATKKYSELDFVGIETVANQVDASGMTHFHVDVWSADFTFFAVKLVDFGPDGAFGGGDDVEHQIDFPMPAQSEWISYDLLLSDFTGLTTTNNISQYILVGQPTGSNTVFLDNVYFHN